MNEPEIAMHALMPILLRFAADSAIIRRLVVEDEGFRCLAEDYLLAHKTQRNLHNQTPRRRDSIQEYSGILRELEKEIKNFLAQSRGSGL